MTNPALLSKLMEVGTVIDFCLRLRITYQAIYDTNFRSTQGSFTFHTTCKTNTKHHFESHRKPFKCFLPANPKDFLHLLRENLITFSQVMYYYLH